MAKVMKQEITVMNTDGEEFELDEIVLGTVQTVNFGDKSVKLTLKDIVGNRELIQALGALRGEAVQIILKPVQVTTTEVPVEVGEGEEGQLVLTL